MNQRKKETRAARVRWPEGFVRFVELFNRQEYWESHEVLEEPWQDNRSNFYQGMIIYASAFVHAQRGNPTGIRKQMAKVKGYLEPYLPYYMGIDVDEVLRRARLCSEIATTDPAPQGEALRQRIPFPTLELDPTLVRGDEREFQEVPEAERRSPLTLW